MLTREILHLVNSYILTCLGKRGVNSGRGHSIWGRPNHPNTSVYRTRVKSLNCLPRDIPSNTRFIKRTGVTVSTSDKRVMSLKERRTCKREIFYFSLVIRQK